MYTWNYIKLEEIYSMSGINYYKATYLIFYRNQDIYIQDEIDKDVRKTQISTNICLFPFL